MWNVAVKARTRCCPQRQRGAALEAPMPGDPGDRGQRSKFSCSGPSSPVPRDPENGSGGQPGQHRQTEQTTVQQPSSVMMAFLVQRPASTVPSVHPSNARIVAPWAARPFPARCPGSASGCISCAAASPRDIRPGA
ncbi:hypothetical protein B0T18DRAFT_29026 [Schizothecium vesticola]|uniref:Uncharacterized protein n=1 Tax=Schizothecium vesticola TaxID=314040 RepID=A0AA40FB65_9PEZI|nr:hypothetical protein B0T18DRAFT_29026 [Schizothecium vesticola]